MLRFLDAQNDGVFQGKLISAIFKREGQKPSLNIVFTESILNFENHGFDRQEKAHPVPAALAHNLYLFTFLRV